MFQTQAIWFQLLHCNFQPLPVLKHRNSSAFFYLLFPDLFLKNMKFIIYLLKFLEENFFWTSIYLIESQS